MCERERQIERKRGGQIERMRGRERVCVRERDLLQQPLSSECGIYKTVTASGLGFKAKVI